jgi:cell division protein FtsB
MIFERKIKKKDIQFVEIILPLHFEKNHHISSSSTTMAFREVLRKLNNRYVYATLVFLVVILFIDQFNVFEQIRLHRSLKDQEQQIEYYENEISESKEYLNALQNDTATMEKVAREQYMMKRDNEVVYLIDTQE